MADNALVREILSWDEHTPKEVKKIGEYADLTEAQLQGANLKEAYLPRVHAQEADLRDASLELANFHGANLKLANLNGAYLRRVQFSDANLTEANLSHSNLQKAYLQNTNFNHADLGNAYMNWTFLNGTILVDVNLTGAYLDSCEHLGPCSIDHRTISKSGMLPDIFLRGCGLPDTLITYFPSLLNQPISFYSCFISYSHNDKSFAQRLHDQLQGRGIRCWLDEHQILPGDDIYAEVEKGLKLWDKVLLCASENSLNSWWVERELDRAFKREMELTQKRGKPVLSIIPLNLDGHLFEWDHAHASVLQKRLASDFVGWEADNSKFEATFENVVMALQTDGTARELPPESKL